MWQEMLPPAQDLSHAGMQAEHMAGVDQQHHHLAQQHALGHHDPSLLAAHHQALAAAHDPTQHLSADSIDASHAQYAAQVCQLPSCMGGLLACYSSAIRHDGYQAFLVWFSLFRHLL